MKIKVGVFFGGNSSEHEISIISALQAIESMDKEKYEIIPIYISKDSKFYVGENVGDINSYKNMDNLIKTSKEVSFLNNGKGMDILLNEHKLFKKNLYNTIDVAFPIVHGTNVEDGSISGFFQMFDVPMAGCNVISSAVGMDKYISKIAFKSAGVNVLDGVLINTFDYENDEEGNIKKIEEKFSYPVIVKPNNLGSSIGISIAKDKNELIKNIETAFNYSNRVIIEPCIKNLKEVNIAVLGDDEEILLSECEEPTNAGEILSFSDKYMSGSKSKTSKTSQTGSMASVARKLPADITPEQKNTIQDYAKKAFKVIDASGVCRIDFMIDMDTNEVYLNELNNIPGSLSFYLYEPIGLPYKELLNKLIDISIKKQRQKKNLTFSFESNVLNMVNLGGSKNKLS